MTKKPTAKSPAPRHAARHPVAPKKVEGHGHGPAPKTTTPNYGPQPERMRAGHQFGNRVVREAPVAPSPELADRRRARTEGPIDKAAELQARGEDARLRKVRPRPNDELAKRRADRLARGGVDHVFDKRLGIDERTLDTANYSYYWATADQVTRLEGREYEVVPKDDLNGQDGARHGGTDRNDKPHQQVLMRKWKPWDEEDRRSRLQLNREQDEALLRGKSAALKADGKGGADYTPESNSASFAVVGSERG